MKNRKVHRFGISPYDNTIFLIRNWNLYLVTGTNKSRTVNIIKRLKKLEDSEFPYPFTKEQIHKNGCKSRKIDRYRRWLRIFKNSMVYHDKANKNDYMSIKLKKEVRKEFRRKTGLIIGTNGRLCRSQPGGFERFTKNLVNSLKPEKKYIRSYIKIKQEPPTKKPFKDPNKEFFTTCLAWIRCQRDGEYENKSGKIIKFKLTKEEKREIIEQKRLINNKIIDPSGLNCKQRRALKRKKSKK